MATKSVVFSHTTIVQLKSEFSAKYVAYEFHFSTKVTKKSKLICA